jgi:hypothetical protein
VSLHLPPPRPPADPCPVRVSRSLTPALCVLVRGACVLQTDLDGLCQVINVVREEILEGQSAVRGPSSLALEVVLDRIARDGQERLIYTAQKVNGRGGAGGGEIEKT